MPHANSELITRFYTGFQRLDPQVMASCYGEDVQFSDPVFGTLHGPQAADMWRMLVRRAQDFSLTFDGVTADATTGRAHWTARYTFTQTGRTVVNSIEARFVFRDGLIVEHRDSFSLWKWAGQALGLKGYLLGWTPFMQAAIGRQASKGLHAYRASHS